MRKNEGVPSLREQLAKGVEESRQQRAARLPRAGVFSSFDERPNVTFTTRGRVSGLPREKWWLPFAADGDVLYLLEENGTEAHWVRNVLADPQVLVEAVPAIARIVVDADEIARARELCGARFLRSGLLVADLVERGLVIAFEPAIP